MFWNWKGLAVLKEYDLTEKEFTSLYLKLWGAAAETAEYNKAAWRELRFELDDLGIRV